MRARIAAISTEARGLGNHRDIARAFAVRQLGREEEAEQALAAGLEFSKTRLPWLSTMGLIPATKA